MKELNANMKKLMIAACLTVAFVAVAGKPNYDESKIPPYTLEDPIAFADGRKLKDASEWPARRKEILDIFAREMYGQPPPPPETVETELIEEGTTLEGFAIRRQYRMWFKSDRTGPHLDWIVFIPNELSISKPHKVNGRVVCENKAPSPAILFLNYGGNQELATDKEIVFPEGTSLRDGFDKEKFEATRGRLRRTDGRFRFPLEMIAAHGYAVISACYGQVSPDVEIMRREKESRAYTGIFSLWPARDESRKDNVTSLGAWAWALSRGLDLAERIPEIDAKKCVATGCSRLGKTALLAAARDERFAVCVPVQTGGGGAPLAKRFFGENVSTEMKTFPHWFCKAYSKYIDNEQAMPFDQHLLLASIAPRALLVLGYNADWFDPKGEYLACRAASPAWAFLGKEGLPDGEYPESYDSSLIGSSLGYARRGGAHGNSGYDWRWILDFADRALNKERTVVP